MVVFSGYSSFLHWNIVESRVKHHNTDTIKFVYSDSVSRLPTSRKVWGREGRISDRTDADQSSQEVREGQISEEDQNRKQLISALFGGIASGKVKVTSCSGTYV